MIRRHHSFTYFRFLALSLAFVSLCGIGVLAGCASTEKEAEPVVPVQVTPVKRGAVAQTISADAVIFPLEQAVIAPKITSTIRKFYVQRGSHVKKGQLLVDLEDADLAGNAEQSKGEYQQAEASYTTTTESTLPQQIEKAKLDAAAAKVAYEAQLQVYESRKNLYAQGAISRRDVDSAQVALAQARSQNDQAQKQLADLLRVGEQQQLKSASGQLTAAKGKYQNAEAMVSYSKIVSPINGVVTDRPLYAGELATANQPILTVMNTSKLIAKSHVAQSEAIQLKLGDAAEIQIPGADEPTKGRISLISPALDPASTTVEVWVEAIKPGPELKPGMSVSVVVTAKTAKNALVVPMGAIFKTPEGADYVMVAGSDGKAHQTNVKLGIHSKELSEIVSGLKEGEPVITVGGYALPDNTKITVEAAPAAADNGDEKSPDKTEKTEPAPPEKKAATSPAKGKE
jgi:HlyD family secretion protein